MLDKNQSSYHLVLRLKNQPAVATAKTAMLTLRLHPATAVKQEIEALRSLDDSKASIALVVDLSTKDQWKQHFVREADYTTLLAEVMPRLGLPNAILLDSAFTQLPRSDQKSHLKALCDNVQHCVEELHKLVVRKNIELKKTKYSFFSTEFLSLNDGKTCIMPEELLTPEGLDIKGILRKYNIPPNFLVSVMVDFTGKIVVEFSVEIEKLLNEKLNLLSNTFFLDLQKNMLNMAKRHGIGDNIRIYQQTPSSYIWNHNLDSYFPTRDQKTLPFNSSFDKSAIENINDLAAIIKNIDNTDDCLRVLELFDNLILNNKCLMYILHNARRESYMPILEKHQNHSALLQSFYNYLTQLSPAYRDLFLTVLHAFKWKSYENIDYVEDFILKLLSSLPSIMRLHVDMVCYDTEDAQVLADIWCSNDTKDAQFLCNVDKLGSDPAK